MECVLSATTLNSQQYKFNPGNRQCYICLPMERITTQDISEMPEIGTTFGKGKVIIVGRVIVANMV